LPKTDTALLPEGHAMPILADAPIAKAAALLRRDKKPHV
jgi:hypothetical protein